MTRAQDHHLERRVVQTVLENDVTAEVPPGDQQGWMVSHRTVNVELGGEAPAQFG